LDLAICDLAFVIWDLDFVIYLALAICDLALVFGIWNL
jgi:hypothetical protein